MVVHPYSVKISRGPEAYSQGVYLVPHPHYFAYGTITLYG